jgi:hypothetical protein
VDGLQLTIEDHFHLGQMEKMHCRTDHAAQHDQQEKEFFPVFPGVVAIASPI